MPKADNPEDGDDYAPGLILGDGDTAVAVSTSWTKDLLQAADRAEEVGNEFHHLTVVLRERAERQAREAKRS